MKRINLTIIAVVATTIFTFCGRRTSGNDEKTANKNEPSVIAVPVFNQDSAYNFVKTQVDFGPRVPNSKAHENCLEYLSDKLGKFGAEVSIQKGTGTLYDGQKIEIKNIIGTFNPSAEHRILLMAHWDSRPFADQDAERSKHKTPILGANDGASGVGILLEVARNLTTLPENTGIDIIFFDVEDYGAPYFYKGDKNENSWCIGSQYWSKNPHKADYRAEYGILLDMVGGSGAKFYKEQYSVRYADNIVEKVWSKAINAGFDGYFVNNRGGYIIDDHLPINNIRNIPTIDIIQYDPSSENGFNRHWHTTKDDMNNIDKNTLYVVGQTVLNVIFDL